MMWTYVASLCALVYHAYLDHPATMSLMKRWRPQVAAGNLISICGLKRYTRARIALERLDSCGSILSEDMHLFVVTHSNHSLTIEACLWHSNGGFVKTDSFRDLRQWARHRLPHVSLCSNLGQDCHDHQYWRLSDPNV